MSRDTTADDRRLTRRQRHVAILLAVVFIVAVPAGLTAAQSGNYEEQVQGGYNLSALQYEGDNLDVSARGSFTRAIDWSDDGDHLYVADSQADAIFQYEVSDPFNVSTASFTGSSQSAPDTVQDVEWFDNGTRFYVLSFAPDEIREYSASSPYDISTASYTGRVADIESAATFPSGMGVSEQANRIYVSQQSGTNVVQFDTDSDMEIDSAVQSGSFDDGIGTPEKATLNDDGTSLLVADDDTDSVYEYSLSDEYNISSASGPVDQTGIGEGGGGIESFEWSDGGQYGYAVEDSDGIYQYNVTSAEVIFVLSGDLSLDVNGYMRPDTEQRYEVYVGNVTVTENTTVTSGDNDTLTVYQSNRTLQSTDNRSALPDTVTVTAEYQNNTVTRNVTVAKPSVENLDLLPVWWKVNATVGDGMMLWLIVATLAAVVATRAATSFAGVGAYVMFMAAGWMTGSVSDGVMVATILTGLFLGMNLAANVDTTIRGSG